MPNLNLKSLASKALKPALCGLLLLSACDKTPDSKPKESSSSTNESAPNGKGAKDTQASKGQIEPHATKETLQEWTFKAGFRGAHRLKLNSKGQYHLTIKKGSKTEVAEGFWGIKSSDQIGFSPAITVLDVSSAKYELGEEGDACIYLGDFPFCGKAIPTQFLKMDLAKKPSSSKDVVSNRIDGQRKHKIFVRAGHDTLEMRSNGLYIMRFEGVPEARGFWVRIDSSQIEFKDAPKWWGESMAKYHELVQQENVIGEIVTSEGRRLAGPRL